MNIKKYFGPSTLVTAAFIGPGTVTLCSMTGASTGYSLLWVLIFSVFTTLIFQEMAARLGLVTQEGLGEAIRNSNIPGIGKIIMIFISFSAIIIGNAAYEAGNLAGAVLGLDIIFEGFNYWPLVLGFIAALILWLGKYGLLEKLLIKSDFNDILLVIGVIGTTVVPYNLFLHASSVSEKYKSVNQLKDLRIENLVAIILGGVISCCIIICSAKIHSGPEGFSSISDFAIQLEPLLGSYAKVVMAIGFFAAGLSSAITAPLAAAYAARGLFGLPKDLKNSYFRLTWLIIILAGVVVSMLGLKPVYVIKFAQIANGILLPIIAGFLLYLLNSKKILGEYVNSMARNFISIVVLLVTIALAYKSMINVFGS